jgi:hypothetical protein
MLLETLAVTWYMVRNPDEEPSEHGSVRHRATPAIGSLPPGSQVIKR